METWLSILIPLAIIYGILQLFMLRMVLALRIPDRIRFRAVGEDELPSEWLTAFKRADEELREFGFEHVVSCRFDAEPAVANAPDSARFYVHPAEQTVARAMPPHIAEPETCLMTFLSIHEDGLVLSTANRYPAVLPDTDAQVAVGINVNVETLREHWDAHRAFIAPQREHLIAPLPDAAWMLEQMDEVEHRIMGWYRDQGLILPHPDGGSVPSLRVALRFIWRRILGKVAKPQLETAPLPSDQAARLLSTWRLSQRLAPRPSAQRGLFAFTSLMFIVLAGLFWDWQFAALIVGAVIFHEFGHYLAMRWLGYRNLQVLLLPMIGGVATGFEQHPNAANRAFVSLMGPLPGILIGWALLFFSAGIQEAPLIYQGAIVLLVLNYLNLLPLVPLDGGQLVKALIPPRWLLALVLFDLFGAAALIWMGIKLDPLLALIGLIPLFGALSLWQRRKRASAMLERLAAEPEAPNELRRTQVAIEIEDAQQPRYVPLMKKLRSVQDTLDRVAIKPANGLTRAVLLTVYLACFAIPTAAFFPVLMSWVQSDFSLSDIRSPNRALRAEAAAMSMPELVTAFGAGREARKQPPTWNETVAPQTDPTQIKLEPPATDAAIAETETRLGLSLPSSYIDFLKTTDGLRLPEVDLDSPWLSPVGDLQQLGSAKPEFVETIRKAIAEANAEYRAEAEANGRAEPEEEDTAIYLMWNTDESDRTRLLPTAELDGLVLIGRGRYPNQVLVLAPGLAMAQHEMPVLELSEEASAAYAFATLREFLENAYVQGKVIDRIRRTASKEAADRGGRDDADDR